MLIQSLLFFQPPEELRIKCLKEDFLPLGLLTMIARKHISLLKDFQLLPTFSLKNWFYFNDQASSDLSISTVRFSSSETRPAFRIAVVAIVFFRVGRPR
jgi:hypothetical protein